MVRQLGYLGLTFVLCAQAGCDGDTVKMVTSLVVPNRGAEAVDEEGKRKARTTIERRVDQICAENQRQIEEVQAYVNEQVMIGSRAARSATPRMAPNGRSKPVKSGGINSNPYIDK